MYFLLMRVCRPFSLTLLIDAITMIVFCIFHMGKLSLREILFQGGIPSKWWSPDLSPALSAPAAQAHPHGNVTAYSRAGGRLGSLCIGHGREVRRLSSY